MTFRRFLARVAAAAAALCSILAAAACGGAPAADGLRHVTFMLSWAPDTNHIGVYVARNKGYYRDAGLDVDIVAVAQSGAEQAVNNGVADFALSNLTNVGVYATKGARLKQVMQVQQKTSAIWCALASNTAIQRPRDFDGRTFATFGSSESDAVIRRMIETDGGKGDFDKVTVGTSTFQTLASGRADFGGFYATWEGVQAKMNGPELRCFTEPDYGVPGNADSIGIITSDRLIDDDPDLVRAFVQATQRGYRYAYDHSEEAASILVHDAPEANLDEAFVTESMKTIVDGQYWGDRERIDDGDFVLGSIDYDGTQRYFDFLASSDAYADANGQVVHDAPRSRELATDEFLATAAKTAASKNTR
ncbi:ABC transporter substrate-binding protein [Bifidobacterium anseris]|uniref:Thiamine pyrimidine synthase n=1 Tax=Bifidobacterium anseris TaxID=2020963 RepID=A0A2N5J0Z5_9BIFI|nr:MULTISPECIES: ABC transporter substrate-binding protein [Bifidobacterium]PLS27872.1 ABC transporter substrate-binding protein [Bifidobacterium anseris]